jgi:RES domain-containing protein
MKVYRLSKSKFAGDLLGHGAEIAGGRWNSKGTPLIYTSQSRALCLVEVAVHLPVGIIPHDYVLIEIEIPDETKVQVIEEKLLPTDWNSFPHSPVTQNLGDNFVKENSNLLLKVPSAVVSGDFNYLINPRHPQINQVFIVSTKPFGFDERLFT